MKESRLELKLQRNHSWMNLWFSSSLPGLHYLNVLLISQLTLLFCPSLWGAVMLSVLRCPVFPICCLTDSCIHFLSLSFPVLF